MVKRTCPCCHRRVNVVIVSMRDRHTGNLVSRVILDKRGISAFMQTSICVRCGKRADNNKGICQACSEELDGILKMDPGPRKNSRNKAKLNQAPGVGV